MASSHPLKCSRCGEALAARATGRKAAFGGAVMVDRRRTVALCRSCWRAFDGDLDRARAFYAGKAPVRPSRPGAEARAAAP